MIEKRPDLKPLARELRANLTMAEQALWRLLRRRVLGGYRFRRQQTIGRYIADFACMSAKVLIEVDGGQHAYNEADRQRTIWLETQGYRVLRFWNSEVLANPQGVCDAILAALQAPPPPPGAARRPPPSRGR